MYARRADIKVPEEDKPVGFDLIIGDWVAPHGSGEVSDLLFELKRMPEQILKTRYGESRTYDVSLIVTFSNDGDGIRSVYIPPREEGSNLRLDRTAPADGYESTVNKRIWSDINNGMLKNNYREDMGLGQNYYFRVRTQKDENGNIISSHYGKIHGDFVIRNTNGNFHFIYYLNPEPNSRNLEFDPKKSLFRNLSSLEMVNGP